MKAILCSKFGAPNVMQIGECPTPSFLQNEVLIKVKATAINRADTLQRQGKYPPPKGASEILGLEMSGVIEELGTNVSNWKKGDKVCALLAGGGYAEYVSVHKDLLIPIPKGMSFVEAAAIPEVFLTAYQALIYLGQLQKGETILIHAGASGVGTAATQIAKSIGAKVIVTASKGKHTICKNLGVDLCIDYKTENFEKVILEQTNQKGVNFILDFLAAAYFQKNINSLDFDGRMVMLATMGGIKVDQLNMGKIVWKRLKIMGSTLRARTLDYKIKLTQDFQKQFWSQFENKSMYPIIDSEYHWKDVVKAHERMEANLNAGKLVLRVE